MKHYSKFFGFLIILLIVFACSINAQNIQAGAKLDSASIRIGDQTVLHLSIRGPIKQAVTLPVLKDTISGKIQIVSIGKSDTLLDKNDPANQTIVQNYTITSFDAGSWVIPAYEFKTPTGSYKTQVLALQVQSVQVDTSKSIYDIKQPLAVTYTWVDWLKDNWLTIFITVLVVAAIAGAVIYIIKRPKKVVVKQEKKIIIPAHVEALNKLNELRDKKLWQAGQVKEYHSELSDVVREYLEKRYGISTLEQTSDEIFASLKHIDIADANRNLLRQILLLADLVKFAREKPLPPENEQSLDNAIAFVSQTQLIVVEPEIKTEGTDHV